MGSSVYYIVIFTGAGAPRAGFLMPHTSASATVATPTFIREVLFATAGGLVMAPLIGVVMGLLSVSFGRVRILARVGLAVGTLYVGASLFVFASRVFVLMFSPSVVGRAPITAVGLARESIVLAMLGLTSRWYFLLLVPLTYGTHRLLARAWRERRASLA